MGFSRRFAYALAGVPRSRLAAADVGRSPAPVDGSAGIGGAWWGTGGDALAPFLPGSPNFFPWSREAAMSVPTVSRARNMICATIGSLPLVSLAVGWDAAAGRRTATPIPPLPWFDRPDPTKTRNHILAWTADDLMFWGRAWWRVSARYATGFPAAFHRLPFEEVRVDQDGTLTWRPPGWGDTAVVIPDEDLVEFLAPVEGLLAYGWRALSIAVKLDASAERYATTETPSGWLKQTGGEPLDETALDAIARHWHDQRMKNQTAALNEVTDYVESSMDPARLQLVEGRQHQSAELARLANVPAFLVGAPSGDGLTYTNAQDSRALLLDYGAMPYVNCLEQTLSGPNVTPAGQAVALDLNAWLRSPLTEGAASNADPAPAAADPSAAPPPSTQEAPADA